MNICTCEGRYYKINKTYISKIFHVHSFVVLFSQFFPLIWQFKILDVFNLRTNSISQKLDQKNVSNFAAYIIKFIWFNHGDIEYIR